MSENVNFVDELETAAMEFVHGRGLRLIRRPSAHGLLVDLLVEGRTQSRGTSLAIQIRPWFSATWDQVAGHAKREMDYLVRARFASEVVFLVPGDGDPPAPLCSLSGLRKKLASWLAPTASETRHGQQPRSVAFCAMPFCEDYLDVFLLAILPAATASGMDVNRVDQSFSFVGITQRIREGITHARLTIADISGHNANVMYEVGLAHGLNRDVLLIRDAATEIPFDVKDLTSLTYDRAKLYQLQQNLMARLQHIAGLG